MGIDKSKTIDSTMLLANRNCSRNEEIRCKRISLCIYIIVKLYILNDFRRNRERERCFAKNDITHQIFFDWFFLAVAYYSVGKTFMFPSSRRNSIGVMLSHFDNIYKLGMIA